jgi:hypothetical protein
MNVNNLVNTLITVGCGLSVGFATESFWWGLATVNLICILAILVNEASKEISKAIRESAPKKME